VWSEKAGEASGGDEDGRHKMDGPAHFGKFRNGQNKNGPI